MMNYLNKIYCIYVTHNVYKLIIYFKYYISQSMLFLGWCTRRWGTNH